MRRDQHHHPQVSISMREAVPFLGAGSPVSSHRSKTVAAAGNNQCLVSRARVTTTGRTSSGEAPAILQGADGCGT